MGHSAKTLGTVRQRPLRPLTVDVCHPDGSVEGEEVVSTMLEGLTSLEAQLPAVHPGVGVVPVVTADAARDVHEADLHIARVVGGSTIQSVRVA